MSSLVRFALQVVRRCATTFDLSPRMKNRYHGLVLRGFLLLFWSIIALAFSIHTIIKGSFVWGGRTSHSSTLVQPDTHPYFYWGWLIFWSGIGIWVGVLGLQELLGKSRR